MTLYELLRKLVDKQPLYPEDVADAHALIDNLENLNAFGSSALYVGEHECQLGPEEQIYLGRPSYWRLDSRRIGEPTPSQMIRKCLVCGRTMESRDVPC